MDTYHVYRHKKTNKYRAVKEGFCWPAFFFMPFWAFSRRLYLFGLLLFVVSVCVLVAEVLIGAEGFVKESLVSLAQIACYGLIGWFANDMRAWFLRLDGFQKQASISAKWPSHAVRQYIDSNVELVD